LTDKAMVVQAWAGPIQDGDTVILGFTGRIDPIQARHIRERFGELLPGVQVVVLDNVAHVAVYRP
jgi:hypothetical protein